MCTAEPTYSLYIYNLHGHTHYDVYNTFMFYVMSGDKTTCTWDPRVFLVLDHVTYCKQAV